ncbi:MAG: hypothetical protein JJV95_07500 [Sulfurospirillum sp.]|nr:hypothetical protein [Sulfurospirillum sp.]MBL0703805.1 hypothetical protein [Sulfurospirillum sp.]
MNRINPLYIGFFIVVLLIILSFILHGAKNELIQVKNGYKESSRLAIELSGLKKVYTKKFIFLDAKYPSIQSKKSKNGILLSSKNLNIKELNSLMDKILNEPYNITKFEINRIDAIKTDLQLEITW